MDILNLLLHKGLLLFIDGNPSPPKEYKNIDSYWDSGQKQTKNLVLATVHKTIAEQACQPGSACEGFEILLRFHSSLRVDLEHREVEEPGIQPIQQFGEFPLALHWRDRALYQQWNRR